MVDILSEKFGGISRSDVIRRCIEERYRKVFPNYVQKKIKQEVEEKITDEQFCEQVGGKVLTGPSGGKLCELVRPGSGGGIKVTVPIDNRSLIEDRAKTLGLI